MNSFPFSLISIGLLIVGMALAPWFKLFFQLPSNKKVKAIVIKGALSSFSLVTIIFLLLLSILSFTGEYGVYLMMLDIIFGSWLGYALTQSFIQESHFGPLFSKENELLDD